MFLLLSFGIAWVGTGIAYVVGFSLANPLVQLPTFAFSPAIAALVVRRWVTREGFADAGLRFRFRGNLRFYLLAWLAPYGFTAASVGLAAAFGFWHPRPGMLTEQTGLGLPVWMVLLALLVVVPLFTIIYWGEEFGWTSYLRMRLFPGRPLLATLGTGLIWAVWHFPLPFVGYMELSNVPAGLAAWTLMFVSMEVILSWVWLRSGSIWTAGLAHAGNNLVISLLLEAAVWDSSGAPDGDVRTLLTAVPMTVVAILILLSGLRGEGHGLNDRIRTVARAPTHPGPSVRDAGRPCPPTM